MSNDRQTEHVQRELPSPSGVVLRVMALLVNQNVRLDALSQAICADPAMAGRVLKLANAASQAGAGRSVVALPDALQRIGLSALRQVLVSFSLVDRYRQGHCSHFDYARYWSQSLASAVSARALAALAGMPAPEECFTLGLLARIGELALATLHPQDYGPIHQSLLGAGAEKISQTERELFASDRYQLAERLLREWQLPETLSSAVRASGEPLTSGLLPQSHALRLARILQIAIHMGTLFDADPAAALPELDDLQQLRRLCQGAKLVPSEINACLPTIVAEWRDWGSTLNLRLQGSAPESLGFPEGAEVIQFPGQTGDSHPPAEATAAAEVLPAAESEAGQSRTPEWVEAVRRILPPDEREPTTAGSGQLRILLAQPETYERQGWISLMAALGHHLRFASAGAEALAEMLHEPPQVLICDLELNDIDPLILIQRVRDSRPGREMYIIASGPRERSGALEAAFGAGADDYIPRPVQGGELSARLRAARRFIDMQEQLLADREQVRTLATELSMANARLEQAADTDPLTGIANRRRATDRLLQSVREAEEHEQTLGVFLIDLDHFKRVNDTWGHATGDEVLRQAARTLQAYSRSTDLVARFGGEEFLVIAPGTSAPAAAALAERLRVGVARLRIPAGNSQIAVTISAGVSVYDPVASARKRTPEALLHMADEALYRAKDSGRNRVCVAADRPNMRPKT